MLAVGDTVRVTGWRGRPVVEGTVVRLEGRWAYVRLPGQTKLVQFGLTDRTGRCANWPRLYTVDEWTSGVEAALARERLHANGIVLRPDSVWIGHEVELAARLIPR